MAISLFPGIMGHKKYPKENEMKKSSTSPRAKTAKILSSTTVYTGPVFGIRRDEVIEPSGVRTTREVITHPGSVVVLPVLPDGRILLIQQYRHATRQYLWELVAGRTDFEKPQKPPRASLRKPPSCDEIPHILTFSNSRLSGGRTFILLAEGLTARG
jgi:hypothetical protein